MVCAINIVIDLGSKKIGLKWIFENVALETVLAELDMLLDRFGLNAEEVDIYIKPRFLPRFLWEVLLPVQVFKLSI